MACYHPLKGFPVGLTQNGKIKYKITEYDVDHVEILDTGEIHKSYNPNIRFDDTYKRIFGVRKIVTDYQKIPCGTCKGCRMAMSRAWADRCMLEAMDYQNNSFLTLTYDEDHLKELVTAVDKDSGEVIEGVYSLDKKHLQKFHKDLRNDLVARGEPRIRFFACGEYGDKSLRAHFHDIVFNLEVPDKKFYRVSESGEKVYTSEYLNKIWKRGQVFVGSVTWKSCAYTSRYVMKKITKGANDFYTRSNLVPPFVVMSRKPGIARNYYETHPWLFDYRSMPIPGEEGRHDVFPPRYFKKRLEIDDPERYIEIKELNNLAMDIREDSKMAQTDMDYLDLLNAEESLLDQTLRKLKRKGV